MSACSIAFGCAGRLPRDDVDGEGEGEAGEGEGEGEELGPFLVEDIPFDVALNRFTGVAAAPDGTVLVLYPAPDLTVRAAVRAEDGAWSEETVNLGLLMSQQPALLVDDDGVFTAVWKNNLTSSIVVARREAGVWSDESIVADSFAGDVSAAFDDDGALHVAHAAQDGMRYVHGATDELVLDTFRPEGLSLGLDDDGTPTVSFVSGDDGVVGVFTRAGPSSWVSRGLLGAATWTALAVRGSDAFVATHRGGFVDIARMRSPGQIGQETVTEAAGSGSSTSLALRDDGGVLHVAYRDVDSLGYARKDSDTDAWIVEQADPGNGGVRPSLFVRDGVVHIVSFGVDGMRYARR